jgi:hypothetical protein
MQNRTHAVMAQRTEPRDSLDDFPTPLWGTRALIEHALYRKDVPFRLPPLAELAAWDPAANRGHMARPLRERFGSVIGSDVHDYGVGFQVSDFLWPDAPLSTPDLVITNPPFRLATDFVRRSMQVSRLGCAMLVRGTWMETIERFHLFTGYPPALIAQFAERLPMIGGYLAREASSATAYAWVVFLHGHTDTRWRHIPPCRRDLERPDDYPPWDEQARLLSAGQLQGLLERHLDETSKAKPHMPETIIRAELACRES